MKFYSEITKQVYDTPIELHAAETKFEAEKARIKAEAAAKERKAKEAAEKESAKKSLDTTMEAYLKARVEKDKALANYVSKYGSYKYQSDFKNDVSFGDAIHPVEGIEQLAKILGII